MSFARTEAVVRGRSVKNVLLKVSPNSQENTFARGPQPATLLKKRTGVFL